MKIALVFPPYNLIKEAYGSKKQIKKGNLAPLGLGYLASSLEKNNYQVKIIDASARRWNFKRTLDSLKLFNPDVVGISVNNAVSKNGLILSRLIKQHLKVPIVLGGPYPTCFPKKCLGFDFIDFIVLGEGENTFPLLLKSMDDLGNLKNIFGVGYRKNGHIKLNGLPKPILKLDDLPNINWSLFDFNFYSPLPNQYKKLPAINYITSRGCVWRKCAFCYQAGIKAQLYRRHSPERVVEDIKKLVKIYGIREISFWDDNFLIGEGWVKKFCDLLKKNNLNISWTCYGRVDTPTKSMLKEISKVGCWSIFYGLESGNQDLLDNINKGITLDQIKRVIKWTHDFGMETRGSFMLALPGENPKKAEKTIRFAIDLDLDYAQFLPTYPEFGTKLYDLAYTSGRLVKDYHGRMSSAYIPEGYKDGKQVEYYVKKAYKKFYFRPSYFIKTLKKIRSFDDFKKYYEGFKFMLGLTS